MCGLTSLCYTTLNALPKLIFTGPFNLQVTFVAINLIFCNEWGLSAIAHIQYYYVYRWLNRVIVWRYQVLF